MEEVESNEIVQVPVNTGLLKLLRQSIKGDPADNQDILRLAFISLPKK